MLSEREWGRGQVQCTAAVEVVQPVLYFAIQSTHLSRSKPGPTSSDRQRERFKRLALPSCAYIDFFCAYLSVSATVAQESKRSD